MFGDFLRLIDNPHAWLPWSATEEVRCLTVASLLFWICGSWFVNSGCIARRLWSDTLSQGVLKSTSQGVEITCTRLRLHPKSSRDQRRANSRWSKQHCFCSCRKCWRCLVRKLFLRCCVIHGRQEESNILPVV